MAKILAVDDDPSIVQVLEFMLNRDGHEVFVAHDGEEGLALARQEHPDLILLDIMMPRMDGFTVSGELFKDPSLRDTPIIILTAKGNAREIFELVPNVTLYLEKPFDPQDLRNHIRKLLPPQSQIA